MGRSARRAVAGLAPIGVIAVAIPAAVVAPAVAGDVIVGFDPSSTPAQRRSTLASLGLEIVRELPPLIPVRARPIPGRRVIRADLAADPVVTAVGPVGLFGVADVPIRVSTVAASGANPNDPGFPRQWNLPMIQIPEAWGVSRAPKRPWPWST